jgi:hypothetical protein
LEQVALTLFFILLHQLAAVEVVAVVMVLTQQLEALVAVVVLV